MMDTREIACSLIPVGAVIQLPSGSRYVVRNVRPERPGYLLFFMKGDAKPWLKSADDTLPVLYV